eukprot:Opistho-2@29304
MSHAEMAACHYRGGNACLSFADADIADKVVAVHYCNFVNEVLDRCIVPPVLRTSPLRQKHLHEILARSQRFARLFYVVGGDKALGKAQVGLVHAAAVWPTCTHSLCARETLYYFDCLVAVSTVGETDMIRTTQPQDPDFSLCANEWHELNPLPHVLCVDT